MCLVWEDEREDDRYARREVEQMSWCTVAGLFGCNVLYVFVYASGHHAYAYCQTSVNAILKYSRPPESRLSHTVL